MRGCKVISEGNVYSLQVHIGLNLEPLFVGNVTYKTALFDNPKTKWGIIGGCIGAGLIAVAEVTVIVKNKIRKRQK